MTPTLVLSACDALMAQKMEHREHIVTFAMSPTGDPMCLVCRVVWPDATVYLDGIHTPCPGYQEGGA